MRSRRVAAALRDLLQPLRLGPPVHRNGSAAAGEPDRHLGADPAARARHQHPPAGEAARWLRALADAAPCLIVRLSSRVVELDAPAPPAAVVGVLPGSEDACLTTRQEHQAAEVVLRRPAVLEPHFGARADQC